MDQKCNQDSTDKNYRKNFGMANPTKADTWKIKKLLKQRGYKDTKCMELDQGHV